MNVVCSVAILYSKPVTYNSSCLVARIIIPKPWPAPGFPSLLHFHFILYMFNCVYPSDGLYTGYNPLVPNDIYVLICLPLMGSMGILNFVTKGLIYVGPLLAMLVLPFQICCFTVEFTQQLS